MHGGTRIRLKKKNEEEEEEEEEEGGGGDHTGLLRQMQMVVLGRLAHTRTHTDTTHTHTHTHTQVNLDRIIHTYHTV